MTNIISIVNKSNKSNKITNKLLQLSIFTLALLILIQLPILYQTVSTGTVHFSIWNSIQMDISEYQFQTSNFIFYNQ
jgi:hypothetical protein